MIKFHTYLRMKGELFLFSKSFNCVLAFVFISLTRDVIGWPVIILITCITDTVFAVSISGSAVVDSLLIVIPIVGISNCSMFCCALLCVHCSFAIISMGKRELVDLLCLSSWCLVIVVWLFLTIPRVCLQFVIVAFPDHTHLLFLFFSCSHAA